MRGTITLEPAADPVGETGQGAAAHRRHNHHRRTVELTGLDHVEIAIPRGEEALARLFYGGVLGLQEVRKPRELARRGGIWLLGPGVAVHLGVEEPFRPARKAHPAFVVADLAHARACLAAHGLPTDEDASGLPIQRCYLSDPFGNRIELVDASDAGFTDPRRRRRSRAASDEPGAAGAR
jgi:catechol 2,3-dioxygenase-like lactoylglutathione lyase family enzyme